MDNKLHRNESTDQRKKIWEAVDRAANRAPKKAVDRLQKKPDKPPAKDT